MMSPARNFGSIASSGGNSKTPFAVPVPAVSGAPPSISDFKLKPPTVSNWSANSGGNALIPLRILCRCGWDTPVARAIPRSVSWPFRTFSRRFSRRRNSKNSNDNLPVTPISPGNRPHANRLVRFRTSLPGKYFESYYFLSKHNITRWIAIFCKILCNNSKIFFNLFLDDYFPATKLGTALPNRDARSESAPTRGYSTNAMESI